MNSTIKTALVAALLAVGTIAGTTAPVNAQTMFDPARAYGSVALAPDKTTDMIVRVPTGQMGAFHEIGLPFTTSGVNVQSVLKIIKVSGPDWLGVELKSARLERTRDDRERTGGGTILRLELRIKTNISAPMGAQAPVEITLENTQNSNRTVFFITALVR
jgi:hypothetical protein